ncbi:MAG: DUF434 domain-containing protein [Candidatus Hydrothermarchaeota archaeon]
MKAANELRFLLNHGYKKKSALKFVSDHHMLSPKERNLLARAVFSKKEAELLCKRRIKMNELENLNLGIDGYNVLITTECILMDRPLIKCDDSFIRDVEASFGKYRINEYTMKAMNLILDVLSHYPPREVVFVFDSPVRKSGELSSKVKDFIEKKGLNGTAITSKHCDRDLLSFECIATSDHVLIKKSKKVVDIPSKIIEDLEKPFYDVRYPM